MSKPKLKKIKKYAGNAYEKVPKKKIINKAAVYGAKQVIGGPYLDLFSLLYKKTKKKALTYAGAYAYESFFRSKFAREKINGVPMSIIALVIRSIFNFLIFSRLRTGIYWLDFIMSMIVTVIVTLLAPVFYTSIKAHEDGFMRYTNIFVDNFLGPNGWDYVENFKNKMLFALGLVMVIILQFVTVDSRYLQELIIHTLITGFISDQVQQWIDSLAQIRICYIGMEMVNPQPQYIVPAVFPLRYVKKCHTKNRVLRELKPLRATVVHIVKDHETGDLN